MTSYLSSMIFVVLLTVCWPAAAENNESVIDSSGIPEPLAQVLADAAGLHNQNQTRGAIKLLQTERNNFDNHPRLVALEIQLLLGSWSPQRSSKLGRAVVEGADLIWLSLSCRFSARLSALSTVKNGRLSFVQKRIELQDFETAIAVSDLALLAFPDRQADFYTLKGEALYKMNALAGGGI